VCPHRPKDTKNTPHTAPIKAMFSPAMCSKERSNRCVGMFRNSWRRFNSTKCCSPVVRKNKKEREHISVNVRRRMAITESMLVFCAAIKSACHKTFETVRMTKVRASKTHNVFQEHINSTQNIPVNCPLNLSSTWAWGSFLSFFCFPPTPAVPVTTLLPALPRPSQQPDLRG